MSQRMIRFDSLSCNGGRLTAIQCREIYSNINFEDNMAALLTLLKLTKTHNLLHFASLVQFNNNLTFLPSCDDNNPDRIFPPNQSLYKPFSK